MTTPQEPAAQVRKILNHYNSHLADIMKKYVVAEPRIKPGRSNDFDSDITHQMDIEQASLLRIIEAEATRRERQAVNTALEELNQKLFFSTTQPDGQFIKDTINAKLKEIEDKRLAELKSGEQK